MSDWQVGDLAVCVDAAPQRGDTECGSGPLSVGSVYTVTGIFEIPFPTLDRDRFGFTLAEVAPLPGRMGFCADRFRKIRPDEREACEPEFVTLLKRSRKTVRA